MLKKIKCTIIALFIFLSIYCISNVNVYAGDTITYSKGIYENQNTNIVISKNDGEVYSCKSSNKKVVKVKNNGNKIKLYPSKTGKSVISIKTSTSTIKYYIYVAKDKMIKSYSGSKVQIKVKKINKVNKNAVLRIVINNGRDNVLDYENAYVLQKKSNGKWITQKLNSDVADNAYSISGKSGVEFSIVLSNYYDNLEKATYRMKFYIGNKTKYIKFKIK